MAFNSPFEGMASRMADIHQMSMGERVIYKTGSVSFAISGIVSHDNDLEVDLGEFSTKNTDLHQAPIINFRKYDFVLGAGGLPQTDDTLVMRGKRYTVIETFDDSQGEVGVRIKEGDPVGRSKFARYCN